MFYLKNNLSSLSLGKLLILAGVLFFATSASYLFAAWSNPSSNPTGGNVDAPLNTGTASQVKDGGLSVDNFTAYGTILTSGHNTDSARMELGYARTGSGYAYLDLTGDTTYPDYGLRILRGNGGPNTWTELRHRGTGGFYVIAHEAAPLVFRTSNTDRMVINANGWVRVGSGSGTLHLENQSTFHRIAFHELRFYDWNAGGDNMTINNGVVNINGDVYADAFIYNSDETLKQNIKTITDPLELVTSLRGVTFDWKEDGSSSYGFIAQELEEVLPELVKTSGDGTKAVEYGNIISILVEAIKEQQEQMDEQQAQIDKQQTQIDALTDQLNAINY